MAIDADSKLIVSDFVGGRDDECAMMFMDDVAKRLATRFQPTIAVGRAQRCSAQIEHHSEAELALAQKPKTGLFQRNLDLEIDVV